MQWMILKIYIAGAVLERWMPPAPSVVPGRMILDFNLTAPAATSARMTVAPPAAFILDPVAAYRQAIATYFTVGSISVLIWDILINLRHDFQLLREHKASVSSFIYFVSRISTMAFALLEVILLTMPIDNCKQYQITILFFYNLVIASTMLLSYFRVCAIWHLDRAIKAIFGFLWLAGVCGSLTSAVGITSRHEHASPYCTESVSGQFVSAAVISPVINHLCVFVAITYGVCKHSVEAQEKLTIKKRYKVFVLGESLPAFSKAVLQACQMCYLGATVAGILAVVWFFVFSSCPSYRLAMFVPYAVTINILFSWVFRRTKLGMHTNPQAVNQQAPLKSDPVFEVPNPSYILSDINYHSAKRLTRNSNWYYSDMPALSHIEIEVNEVEHVHHDDDNANFTGGMPSS